MPQNAEGAYDIYFAPEAPGGKEGNWFQTVPGKKLVHHSAHVRPS